MQNERIPYRATEAAAAWTGIGPMPVSVLLENVRSLYNVGAFFRTGDAVSLEKLYLAGITGYPPQKMITKTALGAEETVAWERTADALAQVLALRTRGYEIAAIETSVHAVDLFDWQPRFPVCVLFGHETDGLTHELAAVADTHVRIPMLGRKHSLNVATAGGVVLYELFTEVPGAFLIESPALKKAAIGTGSEGPPAHDGRKAVTDGPDTRHKIKGLPEFTRFMR